MPLILDTSAVLALAYEDEDATYAESVLENVAGDRAVVPTLFWFEIRNALLMGERRGRISREKTTSFLSDLALFPFEVDDQPREAEVMELARRYRLTIYDAAYLELAQRRHLPLATVDAAIIRAASAAGVHLFTASE
ncbi:MAG: hypothetical protein AMXMBFR13_33260 [Phycisphaerae bacterium]